MMRRKSGQRIYEKEEARIIISITIIVLLLCSLFYILVDRYLVSSIDHSVLDALSQFNMRRYIEYFEDYERGIYNEPIYLDSPESTKNILYSMINNESTVPKGVDGVYFPVYRKTEISWIASRDRKDQTIRSDYLVFRIGESVRILADIRACYSDEEYERIFEYFEKKNSSPAESFLPYMDRYVLKNGIAYPLLLSFRKDGQILEFFYPDIQIEYDESEVIESDECILADGMIRPLDPDYMDGLNYAKEKYDFFCEKMPLPSEYVMQSRGRIVSVLITPTENYVACQVEIYDYSETISKLTIIGFLVIISCGVMVCAILCGKARRKRIRAEYERSVTNALAHNYKSSLMVIRSCAENLIAGVSDETKVEYEQNIIDETDHLNESTEKILSFYRTGAAGYNTTKESIDASSACQILIKKYEKVSRDRKLRWMIDDAEKFILEGDAVLFSMAVDNLIGNATKYALTDSEIRITTDRDSIAFENNWKCITKLKDKPKLFFEAFVTGDDQPGRSNSGIGLRVTKDLLERMDLRIDVRADIKKVIFVIKRK